MRKIRRKDFLFFPKHFELLVDNWKPRVKQWFITGISINWDPDLSTSGLSSGLSCHCDLYEGYSHVCSRPPGSWRTRVHSDHIWVRWRPAGTGTDRLRRSRTTWSQTSYSGTARRSRLWRGRGSEAGENTRQRVVEAVDGRRWSRGGSWRSHTQNNNGLYSDMRCKTHFWKLNNKVKGTYGKKKSQISRDQNRQMNVKNASTWNRACQSIRPRHSSQTPASWDALHQPKRCQQISENDARKDALENGAT